MPLGTSEASALDKYLNIHSVGILLEKIAENVPTRGRRLPPSVFSLPMRRFAWVPTSLRHASAISGLHLVIRLVAVVLDTGLVGVHPRCGGVIEGSVRQASGLPAVLDLERTQGRMRAGKDCSGTSVGGT